MFRNVEQTFDVRVDPDQERKYEELVELLVAAGYFRARISSLKPFDKVVGGLAWCITSSNCDVHVDLDFLFQQSFTIGSKIALTEKIVDVLPQMNCPFRLSPHQIQGLDCINIFQVLQWLVKKVIEARKEKGDSIRNAATCYFNTRYSTPEDKENEKNRQVSINSLDRLHSKFKSERQFQAKRSQSINRSRIERAQQTLIEYGSNFVLSHKVEEQTKERKQDKTKGKQKRISVSLNQDIQNAEKTVDAFMKQMTELRHSDESSISSTLEAMVNLNAIEKMTSKYELDRSTLANESSSNLFTQLKLQDFLKKQVSISASKLKDAKEKQLKLEQAKEQLLQEHKESVQYIQKIERETLKLETQISPEEKEAINSIQTLLVKYEKLKEKEKSFKKDCLKERNELREEIEILKTQVNSEEWKLYIKSVNEKYEKEKERYDLVRRQAAKTNVEIAMYRRKIDCIPTQIELTQYQKRFMELYDLIQKKHLETKYFYSSYNMLSDTSSHLKKEISLLESIHSSFLHAMGSTSQKQNFSQQFSANVNGIATTLKKVDSQYQRLKDEKDLLTDQEKKFAETEHRYFKFVREFQKECKENEELLRIIKDKENNLTPSQNIINM